NPRYLLRKSELRSERPNSTNGVGS
ncbi:RNA polymerase beta subunit, partial [Vibrio harveyi]